MTMVIHSEFVDEMDELIEKNEKKRGSSKYVQPRVKECYDLLYKNAVDTLRWSGKTVVSREHYDNAFSKCYKHMYGRRPGGMDDNEVNERYCYQELKASVERLVGFEVDIVYSPGDSTTGEAGMYMITEVKHSRKMEETNDIE